ncbi:MAG: OmpH family outer membrane protein [Aquificota bacterium]|nr:MAG: OmpH family outer membrane protein [Aquificota bacterium]
MKKLVVFMLLAGSLSFAQQKFACIDPNRILQESKSVKEKEEQLRSKVQEYQKQLDEINKRLEDLKRQIESKGISQKAREEKIKEYQQTEAKGMELQQKAQRELIELKGKMEDELIAKVRNIAEDMAKKGGYTGILDCSAFVYRSAEVDLTQEVIKRLDQR